MQIISTYQVLENQRKCDSYIFKFTRGVSVAYLYVQFHPLCTGTFFGKISGR